MIYTLLFVPWSKVVRFYLKGVDSNVQTKSEYELAMRTVIDDRV